ncbi:MAG: hypothetical protein WBP37_17455, partial [Candidatus Dechloromonas phosphoritropha]
AVRLLHKGLGLVGHGIVQRRNLDSPSAGDGRTGYLSLSERYRTERQSDFDERAYCRATAGYHGFLSCWHDRRFADSFPVSGTIVAVAL